ncbi:hypothetical protein [Puniceibacterium sp. IMCC21224]|nr:hypothetical protein [Puniceibacterium sp. IMCC21224]KMK67201.1 hypothetical protein IMCC21224_112066 [Puniceibacterium sp. IMCC21224]
MKLITILQAIALAMLMVAGAYASARAPQACPSVDAVAQCEL